MYQAVCYEKLEHKKVRCNLCRHRCIITEGGRGICRVRENRGGDLYPLSAGLLVAENSDPIEKKPLYHFLPGSRSYSIASVGCNFSCLHCQNAGIARYDDHGSGQMPGSSRESEQLIRSAVAAGCRSISYTYTEPTVWFESALATARLASEAGLYNLFVTNGYIGDEALKLIVPFLHGANIDLKGFTADFYRRVCGADLAQVLEGIRSYRRAGIWLEITTLLIPGENDDQQQLDGIAGFIANELGSETPWHISRFFPCHRMADREPTSQAAMQRGVEAGLRAGLRYIYEGNIQNGREDTICPGCGAALIRRRGYQVIAMGLDDGACRFCGRVIPGIWG